MRPRHQRGFTLIELMIWVVLTVVFVVTIASFGRAVHEHDRSAAEYSGDLAQIRRAVRNLEQDVRSATRVETSAGTLRLRIEDQLVQYTWKDGQLRRSVGSTARVVARRIGVVRAEVEDRLVALRVQLMARRTNGAEAAVHSVVAMRTGGHP